MRSTKEKSMLWCGETIKWQGETIDNNKFTVDLTKTPEEIKFDKSEEKRKIKLAAQDIEFMNTLSADDMDLAFGTETFCKANALLNETKMKEEPIIIEQEPIICSELDQLVANKRFLPTDEQTRYDNQKQGAKKWVTLGNIKRYKRQCYKEYETKIRNGFYTGFVTSVLCETCENVLDCIPSPYKRLIWLPSAKCIYCNGKFQPVNFEDLRYLWNLHESYKQKKGYINMKHGVKGSITAKLLTTHGQDLSAPFEHCWLKQEMPED